MENFIAPLACGLRAARKPVALILAIAALGTIPAHNAAAQGISLQNSPPQNNYVNFPASNPPNTPQNSQANGTAPAYNPGDPVYIDTQKILAASQAPVTQQSQTAGPQAVAPPEVMREEMQSLNLRLSSCQNDSSCTTLSQLRMLTDASDAMHESLLRITGECTLLNTTACLSRQYTELQQWSAMNDRMGTMLESVAAAAGSAQTMVMSEGAPPTASALNNMAPAAGNPEPSASRP